MAPRVHYKTLYDRLLEALKLTQVLWCIYEALAQFRLRHEVLRHKSKRVSQKIPLPQESREFLEIYLESRVDETDAPLFVTRYGTRLKTLDVYRICQRVLKQALAQLKEHEKFEFTPHKLRHTFLKKVTDSMGFILLKS